MYIFIYMNVVLLCPQQTVSNKAGEKEAMGELPRFYLVGLNQMYSYDITVH